MQGLGFSRFFILSLCFIPSVLTGCASSSSSLERQLITSNERVYSNREAQQIYNQVAAESQFKSNQLSHNNQISRVVNKIARTSHARGVYFTAYVVDDPNPNAFSIGGKHVFVTKGMVELVGGNEEQLAGMLAHEIAHDLAGHHNRQTGQGVAGIANALIQNLVSSEKVKLASSGAHLLYSSNFSRGQEKEADILGTVYAYRAGYDTNGFINFFNRMQQMQKTGYLESFISSHPHTPKRAETVRRVAQYLRGDITMAQLEKLDANSAQVMMSVERVDQLLKS